MLCEFTPTLFAIILNFNPPAKVSHEMRLKKDWSCSFSEFTSTFQIRVNKSDRRIKPSILFAYRSSKLNIRHPHAESESFLKFNIIFAFQAAKLGQLCT